MVRVLTAVALAALLASPALAQNVAPPADPARPDQQMQQPAYPGGSSQMERAPQSGQAPSDCLPNDIRPECQTAQLPGQNATPQGEQSQQDIERSKHRKKTQPGESPSSPEGGAIPPTTE